MAKIDFPDEIRKQVEGIGTADLVIGIAGGVPRDEMQAKVAELGSEGFPDAGAPLKCVVVYAGPSDGGHAAHENGIELLSYPLPAHDPALGPWVEMSSAQRSVLALSSLFQAKLCVVLHCDLATLNASTLKLLTAPVLEGKCDLVMPVYPEGKYDGLLNKSLLAPLSRALFSKRVRSPLPFDFCASARVIAKLADPLSQRAQPGPQLLWPSNVVAMESGQIWQAQLDVIHTLHTEGLELTAVLAQLAGGLFQEVENCASHWQRARGSQTAEMCGVPFTHTADAAPVDAKPLIDSFVLGSRNLEEVWRLVLPPVSLFELKRLTALAADQFRMPDQLWARLIYDFALAHRLRRIGRAHLLGALTPLYLGWVASYAQEVAGATVAEADARLEKLARVFEENKPYFVSRWRWPDRTS
jgi:glucosylglycerate synthase